MTTISWFQKIAKKSYQKNLLKKLNMLNEWIFFVCYCSSFPQTFIFPSSVSSPHHSFLFRSGINCKQKKILVLSAKIVSGCFFGWKSFLLLKINFVLSFQWQLAHGANICPSLGVPTVVKTNILIRSMGPVSELDMVCALFSLKLKDNRSKWSTLQDYSMDCYFRQYWRDKRLSFKSPIKSLSLSIKVRPKVLHDVILNPSYCISVDAGANMATRHILLQCEEISYPHNYRSQ